MTLCTYHVGHRLQITTGLLHDDAIVESARIRSAHGTSARLRVSQLTLGFVPVRRSGLLETLYLACHRSCINNKQSIIVLIGSAMLLNSPLATQRA